MTDTLDEIWDSLFGGGGPAEPSSSSAPPQPSNPVVVVSRPVPVAPPSTVVVPVPAPVVQKPPSIVVVPTRPAPTPVVVPTKPAEEAYDDGEPFFADCCSRTCIIALLLLVASGASIGVIYVVVSLFNADVRDAYTDRINIAKNSFTDDVTRVRAIPSLYNSSDLAPVGTKGPPGGRGVIGPQGFSAPGATGLPGPYGPSATGITGPTGPEGPRGPPGQVGERGPQGSTGSDGPQGATGIQGPRGVSGTCGGTCITYQSTINGTETTIWNAGLASNETALDYEIWHNASDTSTFVVNYTTGYIGVAHKHPLVPVHLIRSNVSIGIGPLVLNASETSSMTIATTMLNPLGGRVVTRMTETIPVDFQSGGWDSDSVRVFNHPIYAANANISFVFGATDLNLLSSLLVPAVNCSSSLQCQRSVVTSTLACIRAGVATLDADLSVITPVLISTSGYSPFVSVVSSTSTVNVSVATRLSVSTLVNATTAIRVPLLNSSTLTQATTLNTSTLVAPSVVATTSTLVSSSLVTQTLQLAQNASLASSTTMNSVSCPVIQSTNFSMSGVFNCSLLSVPSMSVSSGKVTVPSAVASDNATCTARTTAPSVSVTNTTTLLGPISVTSMCTVPDLTVSNTLTSSVLQIGTLYSNETLSQTTLSISSSLTTDNITANRWGNDRLGYQILTPATGITNAGYPCRTVSGAYSFSMPSTGYLSTGIKVALTLRCSVPERCALNYCCFKFPTGRPNGGNSNDQQFGYAKCSDTEIAAVSLPSIKQASSGGGCGCYWAGFQCASACGAGVVEINAWGVYGFGS